MSDSNATAPRDYARSCMRTLSRPFTTSNVGNMDAHLYFDAARLADVALPENATSPTPAEVDAHRAPEEERCHPDARSAYRNWHLRSSRFMRQLEPIRAGLLAKRTACMAEVFDHAGVQHP